MSDIESVTSDISTSSDKIKVFVYSRPKFSNAVTNKKFSQHFKEFQSGIDHAFIVKDSKTRQSQGFGIIFFSSLEMANLAIQKMRSTKVMGEFQIISIGFGKGEPSGPSLVDRTEFNDGASIASGRSGFQPTYSGPVHSQPPADCVIIENIDPSFSESEIRALISAPMLSFNRLPPPSNGVMIKFYPNTDAHAIAQSLNGKNVMDRCIHAYVPRTNPAPPSNVDDPQQASVKVTHLPLTITKEKLHLHFLKAGEIKGEPVIHVTDKSVYAHVNFHQPMSAQNAVSMLNNSVIDGTTIRVKLARMKSPNVETKSIERDNYEKVLKLDPNQWNTLMLVNPNSGTSLFQDTISPYKSNPNVLIKLEYENQSVKFSGKFDAVEDAYSTLKRQLNKELPVDEYVQCRLS